MCDTCGCSNGTSGIRITRPGEEDKEHSHSHGHHDHDHPHSHGHHDHDHPHSHGHHDHDHPRERLIRIEEDVLGKNKLAASRNSGYFEAKGITALNLMSSPGSGKTTLLERTMGLMQEEKPLAVIEGDQQTMFDAERIRETGVPVVQVNTGNGCHLDAEMIRLAVDKLDLPDGAILFIENVGNLVCPSLFELGEKARVVIISVTEGEDKPLKYPTMFQHANLCVINKTDLLPHVEFDMENVKLHARSVNPNLRIIELSARTGEGMEQWIDWINSMTLKG